MNYNATRHELTYYLMKINMKMICRNQSLNESYLHVWFYVQPFDVFFLRLQVLNVICNWKLVWDWFFEEWSHTNDVVDATSSSTASLWILLKKTKKFSSEQKILQNGFQQGTTKNFWTFSSSIILHRKYVGCRRLKYVPAFRMESHQPRFCLCDLVISLESTEHLKLPQRFWYSLICSFPPC